MKVLIDSNIVIETQYQERRFRNEACQILRAIDCRKFKAYLTVGSLYTIIYYTEKYLKKMGMGKEERIAKLREYLVALLKNINVVEQGNKQLEKAVLNPDFLDLEDSCQYQAALKTGCDYLVTINTKDFQNCTGKTAVLHPVDFVKVLVEQEGQR